MLIVSKTHLSEKDLSSSSFKQQFKDALPLLISISEKANWSIDEILSSISQHTIEDRKIRANFREYLIQKKYGIFGSDSYSFDYVSDKCIIIRSKCSNTSIVMNAQGSIKTHEGKVLINTNSIWSGCFYSFGRGEQKNKLGIYSKEGDEIVPCIFDHVNNKYLPLELIFKGLQFRAWFGEKSEIENLPYRREDSVLYTFDGGLVSIEYDKFDTLTLQRVCPSLMDLSLPEKEEPDPEVLNKLKNSAFSELDREMEAAGHHRYIKND